MKADHDVCQRSTEGTEFWFGFMEGRHDNPYGHDLTITVTSAYNTSFSIYTEGGTNPIASYSITSNIPQAVTIPWNANEVIGSETPENKGIYLVANDPVNVYAMNSDYKSSDAAVIYPLESIGKQYFAMCYEPHYATYSANVNGTIVTGYNGRNSEFLIVATEDNTLVTITPSKVTTGLKPAGTAFTVTLNKGQTYQVQSANQENLAGQGDLTGSYISADKNIAVYAGNFATTVPNLANASGYDHLYEQMPPLYSWGKEYYAVPMMGRNADRYRILANQDGTSVYVDALGQTYQLDKGEFAEIILKESEPSRILADKPILVAQFSQSQSIDNPFDEISKPHGDPSMIVLSSTDQSKNNVTFVAYESASISTYHVNIVSLTDQVANLRLDGNPVSATPFAGTDYSYTQILLSSSGSHTLVNTDPNQGFLAYVYGQGDKESYGYPVGFNLNIVLDLGESIDFDGDTLLLCEGDTLTLDPGPYFDTYTWSTGETSQVIRVTEEGLYKITTTVSDCPALEDSVYVLYSNPQLTITPDQFYDCFPSQVTLQADATTGSSFLWQSMEGDSLGFDQSLYVDSTALYRVTVHDLFGCVATDTADVIIFGRPPVTIHADSLVCGDLQTTVTADLGTYPDSLWTTAPGGFEWSSNDPAVSFSDESDSMAIASATTYGVYEIYYTLTTKDGCISGDTLQLRFTPGPEFTIDPKNYYACAPAAVELTATVTSDQTGISYLWETLDGKTLGTTSSLTVDSTALYVLTVTDQYGCQSTDTADVIVFGNPPVNLQVEEIACGDLEANVTVDFAGYPDSLWNTAPGGFEWLSNGLTIGNSTDLQATVTAPDYGVYELYYILTTKDNCVSGDTLELQFLPLFSLDFEASDTTACGQLNTQLTASSDDSSLSYEWFAAGNSGFGQTVDFTITDAGLHDVRLIASSTSTGCVDTLTKYNYLEVVPLPVAAFEVDRQQVPLQDATVTFYNNSNYADSFSWIFGDGERSDLFETDHTYTDLGTYRATLIASMDAGCSDSTSMLIQVVMDQIYAPNAFRPDSNIPENRVFMPTGLGLNGTNFILQIYDRWGQVVFETSSTANPWEGFDKSGKEAPMSNYIWMATYSDIDGQEHRQSGQILLIR
ncbi:CHU domain-containing protein [Mangrovibacterium diazotrophicum]|uniref:CHU domain-containing protein n=2 Tax=Mangrovibacterium diazotrophicum TaxID=1261403 RepID=A0A419WA21_9BACT|nr:CHU domain-containing protein [Mangrovibacterium diazotrophicum]